MTECHVHIVSWRRWWPFALALFLTACSSPPRQGMKPCDNECLRNYPLVLPLPNFPGDTENAAKREIIRKD